MEDDGVEDARLGDVGGDDGAGWAGGDLGAGAVGGGEKGRGGGREDGRGGGALEELLKHVLGDEPACACDGVVGVVPGAVGVGIAGDVEEVALLEGEVLGRGWPGGGDGADDLVWGQGRGRGLGGLGDGEGRGDLEAVAGARLAKRLHPGGDQGHLGMD